jgi:hypothetical protein
VGESPVFMDESGRFGIIKETFTCSSLIWPQKGAKSTNISGFVISMCYNEQKSK